MTCTENCKLIVKADFKRVYTFSETNATIK